MANSNSIDPVEAVQTLLVRKIFVAKNILQVTGRELLLVDLSGLDNLLEEKEALIAQIKEIDKLLESETEDVTGVEFEGLHEEYAGVVRSILENERVFEMRIQEEQDQLRADMRELEQQTRLRRYLDGARPAGSGVKLKK